MLSIALSLTVLTPAPADDADFLKDVWPIFEAHCIGCHGPEKQKGKMRLDTRAGLFGEDAKYPPVVPNDLDESVLWELINLPADDPDVMPAEGDPLNAAQIDVLKGWIEAGAPWAQPTVVVAAPDPLAIPALTEEQRAARDAAMARLAEHGLYALQVSAGHEVVDVNLSLQRNKVGDADLELLQGLEPALVWLNLSGTGVGDAGMEALGRFGQLRRLNLSKTGVGDAGLARLSGLGELTYLNLYGTQVTDAGMAHLAGMKKLQKVFLWQTAVTDAGAAGLAEALPTVEINRGAELKARPAAAKPANEKCPVSGQDVDAAVTSAFGGHVVAFCCTNCKGKFDADPESFKAKLALPDSPINETCPVSGQPVDAAQTVVFEGATVGFCCPKCIAAFEKEPAKFTEKLGLKKTAGPVNEKCPVSGQPVDAAQTVVFEGATVGFCCPKCIAAFEKEPAKFTEKLGLKKTAVLVNARCPVSARPVDVAHTLVDGDFTIGFCCSKCKEAFEKAGARAAEKIPPGQAHPAVLAELIREEASKLGLEAPKGPFNETCPVSGQPVDAAHTVAFKSAAIWDGATIFGDAKIGFCCPKCIAAFEKEPAKFTEKLGLKKTAGPVNEKCPVSGQPVDVAQTVAFEGATVGFCCPKCIAAFEKEPAKFAAKLGLGKTAGPVNEKCPVSGQPVDTATTVAFEGKTVGFCCPKCKGAFEKDPAKFAQKIGG